MINTKLFLHNFYKNRVNLFIYFLVLTLPSLTFILNTIMPSTGAGNWLISDISLLIFVVFCYVGTWHITFLNFSFITKRSADDVYSSLPISRTKLYFTQFLSSVAMTTLVLFVSYLINFIISMIALSSQNVYPFSFLLDAFLVILFVSVCSLVGISLSGTQISAFVSSVLVGLAPYALLLFFTINFGIMDPTVNFLSLEFVNVLLENPALSPISVFFLGSRSGSYYMPFFDTDIISVLVTLLICAVYTFIGLIIFKKRPSEVSGNMNLSSKNRAFFRVIITVPFLFLIAEIIILNLVYGVYLETTLIITVFVISLCMYFGYELIATKSFKETIKSAPMFLISVVFVGALTAAIPVAAEVSKSTIPEAEDVLSIQLVYDGNSYFESLSSDVVHTDPQLIEHVMAGFNYINGNYRYDNFSFKITTKNLDTQVRNICLPSNGQSSYLSTLFSLVEESEEHQRAIAVLPDEVSNLSVYSYGIPDLIASEDDILEIYKALKQDFENGVELSYNNRPVFTMNFVDVSNGQRGEVQISQETPIALGKAFEIANKTNSFEHVSAYSSYLYIRGIEFTDYSESQGNYLSHLYSNQNYAESSEYEIYYVYDAENDISKEQREALFDVLEEAQNITLDDNPVSFGSISDDLDSYIFLFTKEQVAAIKSILE